MQMHACMQMLSAIENRRIRLTDEGLDGFRTTHGIITCLYAFGDMQIRFLSGHLL